MKNSQYITTNIRETLLKIEKIIFFPRFPHFYKDEKNFKSSIDVLLDMRVGRAMIRLKMIKIKTSTQLTERGRYPSNRLTYAWREDNSYEN